MKLFPPYNTTTIIINNFDEFHTYIINNTDDYDSDNKNKKWIGKVSANGFILEKKMKFSNTLRPKIKGEYLCKKKCKLSISIHSNNRVLYFFIPFFLFCIYGYMINKNIIISILVFISGTIFLYLQAWLLHAIDLNKTKIELNEIIEMAKKPAPVPPQTTLLSQSAK